VGFQGASYAEIKLNPLLEIEHGWMIHTVIVCLNDLKFLGWLKT